MVDRKAFNFYRSYYDICLEIPNDQDRHDFLMAVLKYQFTGQESDLKGIAKFAFISQLHSLKRQLAGYESGILGGRPLDVPPKGTETIPLGDISNQVQVQGEEQEKEEVQEQVQEELSTDITKKEKIPFSEIVDIFNRVCEDLPKVVKLSEKRKKSITSLLKSHSLQDIGEVFKKVNESDFLSGRSGNWKASFDWIFNQTNFLKVLEGNYINLNNTTNGTFTATPEPKIGRQTLSDFKRNIEGWVLPKDGDFDEIEPSELY
jgi:hypothetical protein